MRQVHAAAEVAGSGVEVKYAEIDGSYIICLSSCVRDWATGVCNLSARPVLNDLGMRIHDIPGEAAETSCLFQRF